MTKETVGKLSSDLLAKQVDDTHSAHEQMLEQLSEYEKNIEICVENSKKDYPVGDFYVVVINKKERLLANVLRNYFYGRYSCPTPDWDQIVYKFHRKDEQLEFLWVIPSKDTCEAMTLDPLGVPAEERELLDFVLSFNDGTLLRKSKQLNGEALDEPTKMLILEP